PSPPSCRARVRRRPCPSASAVPPVCVRASRNKVAPYLIALQRRLAPLASADADHLVDGGHEDLPVPDPPCLGGTLDRLQSLWHHLVGEHHLDLHLGQEIDHVLRAPIQLGVAFLTSEPLDLGDGKPEDAHVRQRLLHFV